MVLEGHLSNEAQDALRRFLHEGGITVVPFDERMFEAASDAFSRFGKGRGHPAKLNFGDCLAYAVARTHALPLLFKGEDFGRTDIESAYTPAP